MQLAHNNLKALPRWVGPTATNITSINIEGNQLRQLPSAVPPNLKTLRLGGNPIAGVGIAGNVAGDLLKLLQSAPSLETFSVAIAKGGDSSQEPWDGLPNDFVVTAIPGIEHGVATCPSGSPAGQPMDCPFEIKTDWNFQVRLSLDFHRDSLETW